MKYPQHKLITDQILEIQYNHTYCSMNYTQQLRYLQDIYNEERLEIKAEEQKLQEDFIGLSKITTLTEQIEAEREEVKE